MTSWQLIGGSLVLLPVAVLVEGAPPALTVPSALGFAYVTLVATAMAYVAWFTGLRRLTPAVVGIVGLLNPLTGVVLGVVVAGEAFGMPQAVGFALVLLGIVVGVLPRRRAAAIPGEAADTSPCFRTGSGSSAPEVDGPGGGSTELCPSGRGEMKA
jgi:drug/metabolite transporter (DMT)-like permease